MYICIRIQYKHRLEEHSMEALGYHKPQGSSELAQYYKLV